MVSDHTFEHIKYEHWPRLLAEFHRVLKVGALLRVAVPDYHAPGDVRLAFWDDAERRLQATRDGHHALTNFVDMRPILVVGMMKFARSPDVSRLRALLELGLATLPRFERPIGAAYSLTRRAWYS